MAITFRLRSEQNLLKLLSLSVCTSFTYMSKKELCRVPVFLLDSHSGKKGLRCLPLLSP